jgi:type I restriction enzyme S subunit
MNAETFCEHFATFADALNGVSRLRQMIMQLAIQGRLVPQDSQDEPADSLLGDIGKFKTAATGRETQIVHLDATAAGFPLPSGWVAVAFGDIMLNRDGERIPVSRDIRDGRKGPYDYYGASGVIDSIDDFLFDKSLLLIGEDGANLINRSTPIAFIAHGKYWVNNHAHVLDGISLEFLKYIELYINAIDLKPYVTGTAQPKMNQAKMNSIVVALPPLAEQRRIVEKVDQLLGLCDELAARQAAQREKRQRLVGATLDCLVSTRNPAEFPTHAHRLRNHFDQLFDTPTTIPQLRQTVLQLAVQGQLVPQDPNDEPAHVLFDRIVLQKNADFSRKNNNGETSSLETESNPPFAQPGSWIWSTLEDVHTAAHTGIDRGKSQQSPDNRYAYLKMNNITADGRCDLREVTRIDATADEVAKYRLKDGDFLFNTRNSAELVGKTCVFTGSSDDTFLFNNNILRVYFGEGIDSGFANLWFCSPPGRALLSERKSSTTNVAAIYQGKLMTMPFPIPPLAEQKRIVTKVTELLSQCDALEAKLTQAESASTKLLSAAVHHLLSEK